MKTMFSHRHRHLFIVLLSVYTFLNTVLCDVYYYFRIDIEWYYALLTIFAISFLSWEGNRLIEPLVRRKLPPEKNKIRFLAGFFLAGSTLTLLMAALVVVAVGNGLHGYNWEQNKNPLKLNLIYAGLISLFFHLLHAIFYFFNEYKVKQSEAEELQRISTQAQLQLVKNQVQPHFLFNNLNVLSGLVMKDHNGDANKFIEEFSKVYRYILNNQDKELVELKGELEFIRPYIFLLRQRFGEGLQVEMDIPEKYNQYYVIPVALQMLIENAIKHNIVSRQRPLRIHLHANGNDTLVVRNNRQPRPSEESSSRIGLQNIRKRYELISDRDIVVKQDPDHFEVVLPLLYINQYHADTDRGR